MNGKIYFKTAADLGEFLRGFCPCTATFEVNFTANGPTLEFTGGH